jgi:hypothetical protein
MVAVDVLGSGKLTILSLNNSGDDNSVHYFISSSSGKPFTIEITDRIGKVIASKVSTDGIGTVDFSEFAHGIYLFRMFNGYVLPRGSLSINPCLS